MHVVLFGGGHVHALALLEWSARPLPGVTLTLISRDRVSPYSGMLPGLIAGLYSHDDIHIDLEKLAGRAGARFIVDDILAIDATARTVTTRNAHYGFDIASINVGSLPERRHVAGMTVHDLAPKPLAPFLSQLGEIAASRTPLSLAIVGAGPAGFELALALSQRLGAQLESLTLLTDAPDILMALPPRTRRLGRRKLQGRHIEVLTSARVLSRDDQGLRLEDGRLCPASHILWASGAAPALDLSSSGLALDAAGFVRVHPTLQSLASEHVFASGDMASFTPPIPKAGVHAVRQAPILADNIRRYAAGRPLRPHCPQGDMLVLLSCADGSAIGTRSGVTVAGRLVWWLKDAIDRRFMARFA